MESATKQDLCTKTFPQIWESLNRQERDFLRYQLKKNGCAGTDMTIWNWSKDKKRPGNDLVKATISKIVGNFIGRRTTPETLFPER